MLPSDVMLRGARVTYDVPTSLPGWELSEETMPESVPHDDAVELLKAILGWSRFPLPTSRPSSPRLASPRLASPRGRLASPRGRHQHLAPGIGCKVRRGSEPVRLLHRRYMLLRRTLIVRAALLTAQALERCW